jgi:hypothetical protein
MTSLHKALFHVEIDALMQRLASKDADAATTLTRVKALPQAMVDAAKPTQDGITSLGQALSLNIADSADMLTRQHAQQIADSRNLVTSYVGQAMSGLQADVSQRLGDAVGQLNEQLGSRISDSGNTLMKRVGDDLSAMQGNVKAQIAEAVDALGAMHETQITQSTGALKNELDARFKELLGAIKQSSSPSPSPSPAPAPVPTPAFASVSVKAAPLLRLLVQVQTLALDATPGQPAKGSGGKDKIGENAALDGLSKAALAEAAALSGAPHQLKDRFLRAFYEFKGTDAQQRSQRFVDVHALIAEIAAFLA